METADIASEESGAPVSIPIVLEAAAGTPCDEVQEAADLKNEVWADDEGGGDEAAAAFRPVTEARSRRRHPTCSAHLAAARYKPSGPALCLSRWCPLVSPLLLCLPRNSVRWCAPPTLGGRRPSSPRRNRSRPRRARCRAPPLFSSLLHPRAPCGPRLPPRRWQGGLARAAWLQRLHQAQLWRWRAPRSRACRANAAAREAGRTKRATLRSQPHGGVRRRSAA